MSRSLYAKLHRRFGPKTAGIQKQQNVGKRKQTLVNALSASLRGKERSKAQLPRKAIVVGAGLAGLSAAWHLNRIYGLEVQVFEARERVGGRVYSVADFSPGRVIEAGAELIGLNHPTWMAFAKHFGLGLSLITSEDNFGALGLEMPLHLNGQLIEPHR